MVICIIVKCMSLRHQQLVSALVFGSFEDCGPFLLSLQLSSIPPFSFSSHHLPFNQCQSPATNYINIYLLHWWKLPMKIFVVFYFPWPGVNRHFQMVFIHEKLNNASGKRITSKNVWEHLSSMYDLQALVSWFTSLIS